MKHVRRFAFPEHRAANGDPSTSILYRSVGEDIIAQCNNPKEAIDKLRATYYPNTLENHAIANTHHGGMGKTEHFLFKICHHFRELHNSGAVVTDRDIMATLAGWHPAIIQALSRI